MNNKNTLIVLIVILVGLITFLGGYLMARKDNFSANIGTLNRFSASPSQENKAQIKNEPKLSRLTTVKTISPSISEDGKKILYTEKGTGKIFATDFSGQNNNFVKTVEPNTLNPNISGVALSKDKQKIAYLYFDKKAGEGQISLANPDGSVFKNILPTRASRLKIDWVNSHLISFYNPKGEDRSLFLLNLENSQLERMVDSPDNLKVLWSPDGTKLLYSSDPSFAKASEGKAQLFLLDLETKSTLTIDLVSEADRCVWTMNSLFVYCGAARNGSDNLYQLEIGKKEFGLVFEPSSLDRLKIKNPLLSPAEDYLFFVNDLDGYLYRINLN